MGDKGKGSQEVNTKEFYFTLFSLPSPIPFLLLALKWEVPHLWNVSIWYHFQKATPRCDSIHYPTSPDTLSL